MTPHDATGNPLDTLCDCHHCGAIFWQHEMADEPDPERPPTGLRYKCPFCGYADLGTGDVGIRNDHESISNDRLEAFAIRERMVAWREGRAAERDAHQYGDYFEPTNSYEA